jgi:hypothetical protein
MPRRGQRAAVKAAEAAREKQAGRWTNPCVRKWAFWAGVRGGGVSVVGAEWDMLAAWWWCGKKEEKKAPDHGGLSGRIAGSKNCVGADISGWRVLVAFARQVNFVGLDHENSPTIFSAWLRCRDRIFRSWKVLWYSAPFRQPFGVTSMYTLLFFCMCSCVEDG